MTAPPRAVVIVDDEADHAFIARRMVADVAPDLPVEVMTDALGVEERLRAAPLGALLLMDRRLGSRESVEMVAALLAERPDLRVAIMSAALVDDDRERALRAGAIAAVEKPASLDGWRALLRGLLAGDAGTGGALP